MKRSVALLTALLVMTPVALAGSKTYQVTGPVLEVRADAIVVQKGNEKWEIARDAGTKVSGDLKKGAKVTVEYRMTAASIEVKDAKGAGKEAPGKPAAGDAKGKQTGK